MAVDGAVERVSGGWVATGRPWYFDAEKWSALREVRTAEADLMRRYAHGEGCLMQFLQTALDDPEPKPCGRCSVCTGDLPDPGARPTPGSVAAASRFFRGQDVVVEPRKIWASGLPDRKGKITFLSPGRALAFADDPAWGAELDRLWSRDAAAPAAILDGMVEVLKRWSRTWDRPTAVVAMPSRRFPTLVTSVAEHLAAIGRLPLVEALAVTGPPPESDGSSATRAKDLLYRTSLLPDVRFSGSVLLVDDVIRSRWTVTVAGSLLAEAGATNVLPLAIHQRP
jgi:ATP-dependent DNA helicase RecQ